MRGAHRGTQCLDTHGHWLTARTSTLSARQTETSVADVALRPVNNEIGVVPPSVHLDRYGTRVAVPSILGAEALLSSIRNRCLNGWQSRLSQIAEAGLAPVLASQHVYWEVCKGLPKVSVGTRASVAELRRCFEADFLPHIRWVQVADEHGYDDRATQVTDDTDVPTAHLASIIALRRIRRGQIAATSGLRFSRLEDRSPQRCRCCGDPL